MSEYIFELDNLNLVYEPMKREEIVRCRDLKEQHGRDISTKHARSGGIGTCDLGLEWTDLYSIVEPNGFCAWGERRDA